MAKREILFTQSKTDSKTALGTLQIDLPNSLHQLGSEIEVSAKEKVLPFYEGKIAFQVTLNDGTITTFEGSLALWPNKNHSKAALEAVKKARREEERKRKEEAKQRLFAGLTPEQIHLFKDAGIL